MAAFPRASSPSEDAASLNAGQLARGLGVSGATVGHYLDLMVDLLLVRRLAPRLANVGKRLVRSPKVYLRDSGLVHALLGLSDNDFPRNLDKLGKLRYLPKER